MKVLTWNVNQASGSRTSVWERLAHENADIVLLQEVTRIPDSILRLYGGNVHSVHPKFFDGHNARFQTAILNSSVKFDIPRDRGNREIVDRMKRSGLTDCLSPGALHPVPTFQHTSKEVTHQLDYVYVNAPLLERLRLARVPDRAEVFDRKPRVSDHIPIVCEFD